MAANQLEESLKKEQEELERLLAQENGVKAEEDTLPEEEDAEDENADDDAGEEEARADESGADAEAEKKDDEAALDAKPDVAAFIKLRKERKEKQSEVEALRKQIEELKAAQNRDAATAPKQVVDADPEPNKQEDYEGWLEWELRQTKKQVAELKQSYTKQIEVTEREQLYTQAVNEFIEFEKEFSATVADYDDATKHLIARISDGIRVLYPTASEAQVAQATQKKLLEFAANAARRGVNPAEELYVMSYERYGYKPQAEEKAAPAKPKIDLKRVEQARKRSINGLGSGSQGGGGTLTAQVATEMTNEEFAKLSRSDYNGLIKELEGVA